MSITSDADWRGLRAAGQIVALTLDTLEAAVRPGVSTEDLDRLAVAVFSRHGARSAPAIEYGFPRTVLISVNDEVVHGIPGKRKLVAGDLVKLDVTVEKNGYVADAARTAIVPPVSELGRGLAECAKSAFQAGFDAATSGVRVSDIGRAVETEVRRWGFSVIKSLTGHGVGRAIHEAPTVANYFDPWQRDVLTDGLVITIEPLITAGSDRVVQDRDGWTIRTRDGSLAAHHEHTLVIHGNVPVLLTA